MLRLRGMVSLADTVVVVGFGEVGPWGNSRTRWEMESYGTFSLEGCIELAWLMGLIKYHNGRMPDGEHYIGWVDTSTGLRVAQMDVKARYEETIVQHCGIRNLEPELFDGYDPNKKMLMQTVALDREMKPIEVGSKDEAESYQRQLGDKVEIWQRPSDGQYMMKLLRGAVVTIPRALRFDRFVCGQIPTGWSAARLGVPPEIISQVDPVTLYALVSTAEALIMAGVTDPYEFYQYVHVSQLGNMMGGGIGGMSSFRGMFHKRKMDEQVQVDIMQETFINTMPAWVNMLLLSASGPVKTPVGACATAADRKSVV